LLDFAAQFGNACVCGGEGILVIGPLRAHRSDQCPSLAQIFREAPDRILRKQGTLLRLGERACFFCRTTSLL